MWQRAFCIKLILLFIQSLQLNYVSRESFIFYFSSLLSSCLHAPQSKEHDCIFLAIQPRRRRSDLLQVFVKIVLIQEKREKDHDERVKKKKAIYCWSLSEASGLFEWKVNNTLIYWTCLKLTPLLGLILIQKKILFLISIWCVMMKAVNVIHNFVSYGKNH